MQHGFLPAALLCLAASVSAQTTWVVDQGGTGNFTTIPAALAVANDGDTILVRAGTYDIGATTTKGVALLADLGVSVYGTLAVANLPAGRTFTMKGFGPSVSFFASLAFTVAVGGCQGAVVIESCSLGTVPLWNTTPARVTAITVQTSSLVTLVNSSVHGAPAVSATSCTLVLDGTRVTGMSAQISCPFTSPSSTAVVGRSAAIVVSRGRVSGGDGVADWCAAEAASPAMNVTDCRLRLTGDASTIVQGGSAVQGLGGAPPPAPAIVAVRGSIDYDPTIRVVNSYGWTVGAINAMGTTVQQVYVPSLHAMGAAPGGMVTGDLLGTGGALAAVFVSLPAASTPTPFGEVFLDLGYTVLLWSAAVPGSGTAPFQVQVSGVYPEGTPWLFQGATLDQGTLALSNPATVVLH